MKYAGLIVDDSFHYLDHLAPLCALLNWPLIVCEDSIAEQCQTFYPQVTLLRQKFSRLDLPPCIVSCDNRRMLSFLLGPFNPWNGRLIWLPHGLSDKGWKGPFFEALGKEDLLLVYGQHMRNVLAQKKINLAQASIGNFRQKFYHFHHSFYERLLHERFGASRFILYAPTWEDSEENGTFWEAFPRLLDAIPPHLYLFIKVHPNTEKQFGPKLERCRGIAERVTNISFLDNFPTIYPLLSRTDVYIGDMSSIGYDFLCFQKPLIFLRRHKTNLLNDQSSFLMQYGKQILIDEIPKMFQEPLVNFKESTSLLQNCFDEVSWEQAAEEILRHAELWT